MLHVVLLAVVQAAVPQPSPTPPLQTITHVRSTPFCTAFTQNIRYSVQGVLMNDDLFKRTEPVFLKAAHDMVNGGVTGFGDGVAGNTEGSAMILDVNRLQQFDGSIAHNLEVIDKVLNDPARFPKQPTTSEDLQLVGLRAQLLAIAKKQNDVLNLISGTTEQYMFDSLYNDDISMRGALSADGKALPNAGTLSGGPLPGKDKNANPMLIHNDIFMGTTMGRLYQEMAIARAQESGMEQPFADALVQASVQCK